LELSENSLCSLGADIRTEMTVILGSLFELYSKPIKIYVCFSLGLSVTDDSILYVRISQ